MKKLIIEQMGLEQYQHLEDVMEFYPSGLKGLITDYLTHYLHSPLGCLDESVADLDFFGRVLEHQRTHPTYTQMGMQDATALILVVKVADIVRGIVQQYGSMLHNGVFDPSLIDWGQEYLLIPTRS